MEEQVQPQQPQPAQQQTQGSIQSFLNTKWIIIITIPIIMLVVYFIAGFFSGVIVFNSFVEGKVIDQTSQAVISGIQVSVRNRGWGFDSGRLVWDKDYVYSTTTDEQGKFRITYNIGPSAHVVISQDGYERFDQYFDDNSNVTVQLKKLPSQPSETTSNWKTYTNTKYGYSLKYSSSETFKQFTCGEKLNQIGGEETFALINSDVLWKPCSGQEWFYNIEVTVKSGNSASKEYYASTAFKQSLGADWKIDIQPIRVNNVPGVKANLVYTNKNDPTGCCPNYSEVRVYRNGFTYILTLGNKDDGEFLIVFDQILSTFKFTDKALMEMRTVSLCDLNADGRCDEVDLSLFRKALGTKLGDAGYSPFADFDGNGVVDLIDQGYYFPVTLPLTATPTIGR